MAEMNKNAPLRRPKMRHRGRAEQVNIYLGKLLRMFVYQNDWKVLPMSALIAGLVGMVIRRRMFISMEGTLMGSFALVCVCIWNGCFNSIQVICRERDVIKREHRSGMHISSYIFSHMVYQAMLCLAQTGVTLFVTIQTGVRYPAESLITSWFIVDLGISMFLITYAADMLSLWVSTLSRTTTTAMTVMPFVLIFQLVFSGGMLTLPAWTEPLTRFTISNPGLKVVAAQADINNRPFVTISDMIPRMRDNKISASVTVGQVLDMMRNPGNPIITGIRAREIGMTTTLNELKAALEGSADYEELREVEILPDVTAGDVLRIVRESEDFESLREYRLGSPLGITLGELLEDVAESDGAQDLLNGNVIHLTTVGDLLDAVEASGLLEEYGDMQIGGKATIGEIVDRLASDPEMQGQRDESFPFETTLGSLMDLAGENNIKSFLETKAAEASYKPEYENTKENITSYWGHLFMFILAFSLLATVTLEFIDKDKR